MSPHSLFKRRPEIESAPLEDECVLFHPGDNRFLRLNSTASFIWSRIEKASTVEEIVAGLPERFRSVDPPRAIGDVRAVLEQMVSLSVVDALPPDPSGPSAGDRVQPQGVIR